MPISRRHDEVRPTAAGDEAHTDSEREPQRAEPRAGQDVARDQPGVMIRARHKRLPLETTLMRIVATSGIIGIGVAIAAIMTSQHSKGWLIGLVVSIVSVVLAAVLWSVRRL